MLAPMPHGTAASLSLSPAALRIPDGLKRGMVGTYRHCGEQHLKRYLAEFDFRMNHRVKLGYSGDMRADVALQGIAGKRLTYRRTKAA